METTQDKDSRKLLKIIRSRSMIETHNLIKHFVNQKKQHAMEEFEKSPNGNTKAIKAVKKLNKLKPYPTC